jgi:hypothetical protein
MKSLLAFLALIIFNALYCFAQLGHVAPCTGANDHSSGNCYGYATGRAGGKGAGDPYCNPTTLNSMESTRRITSTGPRVLALLACNTETLFISTTMLCTS